MLGGLGSKFLGRQISFINWVVDNTRSDLSDNVNF